MNWDAITATSEFVGALAVLVTLIFLTQQMRQNNLLAQAEAERDWFATWQSILRSALGSVDSANLMRAGFNNYSSLSKGEKTVFSNHLMCFFDHADVLRRLNEKGFVSSDILQPVMNNLLGIIMTPGGRIWWHEVGPILTIYNYVDSLPVANTAPLTDVLSYFSDGQ